MATRITNDLNFRNSETATSIRLFSVLNWSCYAILFMPYFYCNYKISFDRVNMANIQLFVHQSFFVKSLNANGLYR